MYSRKWGPFFLTKSEHTWGLSAWRLGVILSTAEISGPLWGYMYTDARPYWRLVLIRTPLADITLTRYEKLVK